MLTLRNPHSALAALQSRPRAVKEIRVSPNPSQAWQPVLDLAQKLKIKMVRLSKEGGSPRDRGLSGGVDSLREHSTQAVIEPKTGVSPEELFASVDVNGGHPIFLALDCIQDPQNLGAIFRSASFFGVSGILMTEERSAPLSATTYDVSAGGVESVPFSQVTNLQNAFKIAKDAGLWILGASEHESQKMTELSRDRSWLIVLGNEEKGLRRLTLENCDVRCAIPSKGAVKSLNVSVAGGILLSHFAL